jgi:NTP pyrophosphatase (non-canonical NTP hydrolase)
VNLDEYQHAAKRTLGVDWPHREQVSNAALGLAGEAGETADLIKKVLYHGRELDEQTLVEELGDCLWYIAALASLYGLRLESIAAYNIVKLTMRYPNGFTQADSIARVDIAT